MENISQQYPLCRVSTIDAIIDSLARTILDGNFKPGSQLREADLASQYKVSRQSIREAFAALIKQGLLIKVPNRGVFIPVITPEDIEDLYKTRSLFEIEAARHAARSGTAREELLKAVSDFEALTENSRWSEIVDADVAFHKALVDSLNSRRTSDLYNHILTEFRLTSCQSRSPVYSLTDTSAMHQAILQAILKKDPEQAAECIKSHLEWSSQAHQSFMRG